MLPCVCCVCFFVFCCVQVTELTQVEWHVPMYPDTRSYKNAVQHLHNNQVRTYAVSACFARYSTYKPHLYNTATRLAFALNIYRPLEKGENRLEQLRTRYQRLRLVIADQCPRTSPGLSVWPIDTAFCPSVPPGIVKKFCMQLIATRRGKLAPIRRTQPVVHRTQLPCSTCGSVRIKWTSIGLARLCEINTIALRFWFHTPYTKSTHLPSLVDVHVGSGALPACTAISAIAGLIGVATLTDCPAAKSRVWLRHDAIVPCQAKHNVLNVRVRDIVPLREVYLTAPRATTNNNSGWHHKTKVRRHAK